MNASKENAQKALDWLDDIDAAQSPTECQTARAYLREFLLAALRKLPAEASFQRDKAKRKK